MRLYKSAENAFIHSTQGTVERPMRLAGRDLTHHHHCHICAFFTSAEDEYQTLLPFIKEGLGGGEKVIHVVDPERHEDHLLRMRSGGIDLEDKTAAGQLDVQLWTETHLVGGKFNAHDTLSRFESIVKNATVEGFPHLRFVTQMEWALEAMDSPDALLEYEAQANYAWLNQTGPVNPVICTYDLNKFSGAVVIDVMRTHPLIIIGGILQENPFYVQPDEFLREIRHRRHGTDLPSE